MEQIPLQSLSGQWYVVRSTLSLWRSRVNPGIRYGVESGDDDVMSDLVTYGEQRSQSKITGTDYRVAGEANGYVWKGNQILTCCVTSRWGIAGMTRGFSTRGGIGCHGDGISFLPRCVTLECDLGIIFFLI